MGGTRGDQKTEREIWVFIPWPPFLLGLPDKIQTFQLNTDFRLKKKMKTMFSIRMLQIFHGTNVYY